MNTGSFPIPEWHDPFWGFAFFMFGCCLGSFFCVCIYRIPLGMSVVNPPSRCSTCGIRLKWWDNIPLFGWLSRLGWCQCRLTKIDSRYFWIELISGIGFLSLWLKFSPLLFFIYGLFLATLLIASVIDIDYYILPDRFTLGGIPLGLLFSTCWPVLQEETTHLKGFLASLEGAIAGAGLLYIISLFGRWAFKKDAMGLGDVKLLAAMGAFLGWPATLFIVAVSSVIGTLYSFVTLFKNHSWVGARLPYGPFLSVAAAIWIFGGSYWVKAYISYLTSIGL